MTRSTSTSCWASPPTPDRQEHHSDTGADLLDLLQRDRGGPPGGTGWQLLTDLRFRKFGLNIGDPMQNAPS